MPSHPSCLKKEGLGQKKSPTRAADHFEKNLINRIFYGKCQGVKDRLMQPKVKFNKKSKVLKLNLTSPGFVENKNNEDVLNNNVSMINTYRTNTEKFNNKKKTSLNKIKYMTADKKRKFVIRKNFEDNEKNIFKGIKSLYLFNKKRKLSKETSLPLLI